MSSVYLRHVLNGTCEQQSYGLACTLGQSDQCSHYLRGHTMTAAIHSDKREVSAQAL